MTELAFRRCAEEAWIKSGSNRGGRERIAQAAPVTSLDAAVDAAFAAHEQGRHAEAVDLCRRLLPVAPNDSRVCFLLGMALHRSGQHAEAARWLQRASELKPNSASVMHGLGCVYNALGDLPRAAESFERSIRLDPACADTHFSLGNVLHAMGEVGKSMRCYREAVKLNPRDHESWNNLGKSLKELNRIGESIAAYDQAVALQPDFILGRCNRAIALLTAGRLEEGFREYEWRWRTLTLRRYPQPVWTGEPVRGKTLLLLAEQGLGDTIQFARYVRQAQERGARVVMECLPPLKRLLEFSAAADAVVAYGETLPAFDCYSPLMSLPGIFHTRVESIPAQTPYLKSPPAPELFPSPDARLNVGVIWAGNPGHHDDAARSIPFELLAPVLQMPGARFFGLQKPVPVGDAAGVRAAPGFTDLSGRLEDLLDTSAFVGGMDLILSVDTAVAHLAGALGRPVWTFIPYSPDWRWLLERTDTPWYPTMRLFRQAQKGDWQPVIAEVAAALADAVAQRG